MCFSSKAGLTRSVETVSEQSPRLIVRCLSERSDALEWTKVHRGKRSFDGIVSYENKIAVLQPLRDVNVCRTGTQSSIILVSHDGVHK